MRRANAPEWVGREGEPKFWEESVSGLNRSVNALLGAERSECKRESKLVSGCYYIIRLGVRTGAKHCGTHCIERANSDGDREAVFT